MRKTNIFSFEKDDGDPQRYLEEALNLLSSHIRPEDHDGSGLKVVSRIRGNAFSKEDVRQAYKFIEELAERAETRIRDLEQ